MIANSFGVLEDDFPQHEDDILTDEVMEASFEHAQDEYEARGDESSYYADGEYEW